MELKFINSPSSCGIDERSNRTFMELKFINSPSSCGIDERSNRTFMELKSKWE